MSSHLLVSTTLAKWMTGESGIFDEFERSRDPTHHHEISHARHKPMMRRPRHRVAFLPIVRSLDHKHTAYEWGLQDIE